MRDAYLRGDGVFHGRPVSEIVLDAMSGFALHRWRAGGEQTVLGLRAKIHGNSERTNEGRPQFAERVKG